MPRRDSARRCGADAKALGLLFCAMTGTAGRAAPATLPDMPLTCTFKAVQAGQFHGVEFVTGPIGGTTNLFIAASPVDLRLGRVALVEEDHAQVAEAVFAAQQTTILGRDGTSTTALSLFSVAAKGGVIPAAMSRQDLIGTIPVVTQAVGSCQPM